MLTKHQFNLPLIQRQVNNSLVEQRQLDGYINATSMCQAAGRLFADYRRNGTTEAFLEELSADMGIPISVLIQQVKGGNGPQGTWVHPNVATHLAQWLSPKFAVAVAKWVHEWMAGRGPSGAPKAALPHHIQRYLANRDQVPYTHFSILTEMTLGLIAPLEALGYTLPDNMVPDISEGKMFASWLRSKGVDTSKVPTYRHIYADGRVVEAKMYPIGYMHEFRIHFNEVWLPTKALTYFRQRDPSALAFLERMLLVGPDRRALPPAA
ncbi:KilA-N domain-containing protein [Xanthomonas sp. CFBP 7698]|uniref:KilA-N domain-containing protein n=1 Tax=Xanthomonas sp. CFBP 7698 TaxID=2082399 RepID=UPI000EEF5A75|nr:KilA-N domain-containing protein [Xanthomonas sp. CFBP 7698]RJS04864.1 DNA-binding protein [Xanthomonas sp. CFBP 7698]